MSRRSSRPVPQVRFGSGGCARDASSHWRSPAGFKQEHRVTGPVILIDPPPAPYGNQNRPANANLPELLYQYARRELIKFASRADNDMPFDMQDPMQMHVAALVVARAVSAFSRHIPNPFPGPTAVIMSAPGAAAFFHPQMPWKKLLPGPVWYIPAMEAPGAIPGGS